MTVANEFKAPTRILVAFDGGRTTRRGIELIAARTSLKDLPVHVIMSGKPGQDSEKYLRWAETTLHKGGFSANVAFIPGDPEHVVTRAIEDCGADLLIMGAYSHSPWRSLVLGSRTNDLLRASQVATITLHT